MNRISRCDWLPERARWSYLARSGYGLCPVRNIYHVMVFYSRIINPLLTKLVRSKWLDIGFILFLRVCGPRLRSINTQKKELGQYPAILTEQAWSITHISWFLVWWETGHDFPTSLDSKISGFSRSRVIGFLADLFFSTLESGLKNIRIRCGIRRMHVDESRIWQEKFPDS